VKVVSLYQIRLEIILSESPQPAQGRDPIGLPESQCEGSAEQSQLLLNIC